MLASSMIMLCRGFCRYEPKAVVFYELERLQASVAM